MMFLKIRKSGSGNQKPDDVVLRYSTANNSNANRTLPTLPASAAAPPRRDPEGQSPPPPPPSPPSTIRSVLSPIQVVPRKQNRQNPHQQTSSYKQEIRSQAPPPPLPSRLAIPRGGRQSSVPHCPPRYSRVHRLQVPLNSPDYLEHVANNEAAAFRLCRRAYVPDLVLNCPVNRNNGTTTIDHHAPADDYYEEIEELLPKLNLVPARRIVPFNVVQQFQQFSQPLGVEQQQHRPREVMGQNLSLRKPRISMTWVLREQQHQQHSPVHNQLQTQPAQLSPVHQLYQSSPNLASFSDHHLSSPTIPSSASSVQIRSKKPRNFRNSLANNNHHHQNSSVSVNASQTSAKYVSKNRLFGEKSVKVVNKEFSEEHKPNHVKKVTNESQSAKSNGFLKFQGNKSNCDVNNNSNDPQATSTKATPAPTFERSKLLNGVDNVNNLQNDYNNNSSNHHFNNGSVGTFKVLPQAQDKTTTAAGNEIKNTYSEPSLCALSEGGDTKTRRHRHKKRRERSKAHHHHHQHFGYDIKNVDEFLSQCTLLSPGNIPVVLSCSSTLYQTRPGYQIEVPLPLGMVVNAVFKNQAWLYVQTPHAEEGYVAYNSCLPLGILPPPNRPHSVSSKCWETNGDVFPKPSGNMTDSEKEVQLRGTKSEGARTPRSRRAKSCGEKQVDTLYLKATSQPKLDKDKYSQIRGIRHSKSIANDEYVTLQRNPSTVQRPARHQATGRHLAKANKLSSSSSCSSSLVRQTLLAVQEDYSCNGIIVRKGDVVTLLACKEYREKNSNTMKRWFYVKTRNGIDGFIPAEVAGNGYL